MGRTSGLILGDLPLEGATQIRLKQAQLRGFIAINGLTHRAALPYTARPLLQHKKAEQPYGRGP